MKKSLQLFFINTFTLSLICHLSIAQPTFEWAKTMGGTNQDRPSSLFVDNLGNIYSTGYFQGTVDFDPGVGVVNLTSNGNSDIFIQKLDPNGNFLWVKQMGGTGYDAANDIAIDANGNIYTTGYFEQNVDFDPGAGTTNVYSANSQIFILKLDSNGDFLWVKEFGSSLSEDRGVSISIDNNENVITTGYFRETSDFDPGSGVMNITSNGDQDIFVQKLDPNGNFIWAKSIGDIGTENAYSVEADISGNIYLAGYFEGTVDFDTGIGAFSVSSAGGEDAFILKLDQNGNLIWVNSMGGAGTDISTSFSIGNSGNIYVAGYFEGTVDFDPGSAINNMSSNGGMDYFIQKIDNNGEFLQVNTIGGAGNDRLISVSLDLNENIYLTGVFIGTVDFDPSTNVESLVSNGSADISIQKLTNSGDLVWVKSFGGVGADYGNKIYVDQNNNVFTTGSFNNTVDFDPSAGSLNLTSNGNSDIFIQKLGQCTPTTSTTTETACNSYTWNGTNYTASGTYTFSTTNSAGCDSTATLNLTIEDVTSPVADVTNLLDINSECAVASLTPPTATDNCVGTVTGTTTATLPISASTTITWTYDDGNGNISTQTQDVIINDVTAPVADNATLNTVTEECEVTSLTPPTATDNCVGTVSGTTTATLPIIVSTTITWTYDDGNGNTSTQTQDVVINDITPPVADMASLTDITSECEVTPTVPTSTDNCVGTITGTPDVSFPITASGTTSITWTYDDGNGNTSTQTQNVIITPIDNNATQVDPITLSADASGYNYQWIDCSNGNVPILGETAQTFVATDNGSYAVEISNGTCSVTSDCIVVDELGLDEKETSLITVYPNPAEKHITIESDSQIVSVTILNALGQSVKILDNVQLSKIEILLPRQTGVYALQVNTERATKTIRVVKR